MLSHESLKSILAEQRADLLKKDEGTPRAKLAEIQKKIKLPHVLVVSGIRRCGKSTLLRQIIRKDYADSDFYYVLFEDERLLGFKAEDFSNLYEVLLDLYGEKKVFFLDEVQNVRHFDVFVRRFLEKGFKFFLTGSNANLLSREISTRLTGRHLDICLRPFSFAEFVALRGVKADTESIYQPAGRSRLRKLFDEYLVHGGMPDYAKIHDRQILTSVYEDVVLKDIVVRYKITNEMALRELYRYVITNFATRYSYNDLAKTVGISSVHTVKNYLGYLEMAFFIRQISKFDYSARNQLVNDKKAYVCDNGFISALSTRPQEDRGWLLENLVFNALDEGAEVYYESGQRGECDFLQVTGRKVVGAVQVALELHSKNEKREMDGLAMAMEKYRLKEGLLLTYDQEEERKIEQGKIRIMPVWKWLLGRE